MKKILVLASTFPRWVGDTNPPFVFELSRRLTKKFDVTVLTSHYKDAKTFEVMSDLKVYRYRYFFSPFEKLIGGILPLLKKNRLYFFIVPFYLFFQTLATVKLVRKIKPDVIHAHWIIPQGIAAYINFLINKTPYIITSHGGDIYGLQNTYLIKLKKIILQNAKSITVVSTAIKNEVIKIDINLSNKIEVIPMGVDSKLFNPNKYDESIKTKYKINGKFLLFVGRLAEKKGVKYLIAAMSAILKKYPKTKLLIVGTGPLELELKNQVSKLKLDKSIIFTGAIVNSELPKYYATADIFVGPSIQVKDGDTEGFGLTFVEALMSGCNVIGTNVGGIGDILLKSNLVTQKNSTEISNKIIELIKNKSAQKIVVNKFDWENITVRYFNEYEK